jgi:hypothetical protein
LQDPRTLAFGGPSLREVTSAIVEFQANVELARRLASDHHELMRFVAEQLSDAIPNNVRVERSGLFRRGKVKAVTVLFGDTHYDLRYTHGHLATTTGDVVGGVMLHHQALPVNEWIDRFLGALEELATHSDNLRAALDQAL